MKSLRERFFDLFDRSSVPPLNEHSSVQEISSHYALLEEFVERKYGIRISPEDRALTLQEFCEKFGLPPAPIVFMEVQMSERSGKVKKLSPPEAKKFLDKTPRARVLDVREEWESRYGKLPRAEFLTPQLLDEILSTQSKDTPMVIYCHHGVRSLDAANFLADRGFGEIYVLTGGIDAWAEQIDATLPRYEGQYC